MLYIWHKKNTRQLQAGEAAETNKKAAVIPVWRENKDYKRGSMVTDPANGVPYWSIHDQGQSTGQVHMPGQSPTM